MGRKSTFETVACIMVAFLRCKTWSQADLAKECGVGVKALRQRLFELSAGHMPLQSEADPPHVYWSVPRDWFPQGRLLDPRQTALVARLLARLPASSQRSQALQAVLGIRELHSVSQEDQRRIAVLDALEDAARERRAIRIDYYTISRGDRGTRDVSVHRVLYEDRHRFLATCHRSGLLKYFRVDEVQQAVLTGGAAFRPASELEVDAFLSATVNGYRASGAATVSSFLVRFPDARWVSRNLPQAPMEAEHLEDGIRFTARVAGVDQLARFVVGLGDAARAETPELRARVHELAMGALHKLKPPHKMNARSVRPIRAAK